MTRRLGLELTPQELRGVWASPWPGRPGDAFVMAWDGQDPVSYTHLDVYKRQARTRLGTLRTMKQQSVQQRARRQGRPIRNVARRRR